MASPFRIFRKNMKAMLAVFVVMLMLSWVVGDSLFSYFAGNRGPGAAGRQNARAVAVTWNGGKLTNLQLNDLVMQRRFLNGFLQQVEVFGARASAEAGVEPRPLKVQRLLGPDTPQQKVEESVVQTRILANAAQAAGMHVSDDVLGQYLDELGRGNVTRNQMRQIVGHLGGGGVSINAVMSALREEMLAHNYVNSNQYALMTVTPEQAWQDWLRVNDRVVVEAAAIPTEKYLADVKEPTEAELQAFFEITDSQGTKYKDREPSPELVINTELPSPTPGFKIPRMIDVQYLEANYDSFLAKAEAKITDEEIKKYYEAHKDPMFIKADTGGLLEDNSAKQDAGKAANPATSETKGASESKPESDDAKSNEDKADATATPEAGKKPADEKPTPETGKKVDEQKPAESSPQPANDNKDQKKTDGDKQSSLNTGRVFHLVAFEDAGKVETAEDSADKKVAAPETKSPEAPAPSAEEPAKKAEEKSAEQGADQPGEKAAAPSSPAPPATPAATPAKSAGTESKAAAPTAPKKPPQFQPLDEVKDVIRRELASNRLAEELSKLTGQIEGELDAKFNKYLSEELAAQADKKEPPAPPNTLTDLSPLAEKYGLKTGKTGPLSLLQMRNTAIGKSSVPDSGRNMLSMLFGSNGLDLYQPVVTVDIDGNRYIAMKISDTPGRVPTLAEVREEVVKAWKFQKAAELAEKHAQELAKKAQEAKEPLPAFFADDPSIKVVRTDAFSELTGGDVGVVGGQLQQAPFRLSQPDGIVAPGLDFMKQVFQLKDGQVTAVLNHDHTVAYVVRLVEHQPPMNELHTEYLSEANTWPGLNNMMRDRMQELWTTVQNDILASAHVDWKRKADETEQPESREGG